MGDWCYNSLPVTTLFFFQEGEVFFPNQTFSRISGIAASIMNAACFVSICFFYALRIADA